MSALGQKQTFAAQNGMSALPPTATAKADFGNPSCPLYPQKRTCAVQDRMSAKGQKRTLTICLVAPLLRASATFPGLPLLCGSSDVVRAVIAEASIARQNIASVVAVFERAILAVPIHTTFGDLDHRAPWGLVRVSWLCANNHASKSGGGN